MRIGLNYSEMFATAIIFAVLGPLFAGLIISLAFLPNIIVVFFTVIGSYGIGIVPATFTGLFFSWWHQSRRQPLSRGRVILMGGALGAFVTFSHSFINQLFSCTALSWNCVTRLDGLSFVFLPVVGFVSGVVYSSYVARRI